MMKGDKPVVRVAEKPAEEVESNQPSMGLETQSTLAAFHASFGNSIVQASLDEGPAAMDGIEGLVRDSMIMEMSGVDGSQLGSAGNQVMLRAMRHANGEHAHELPELGGSGQALPEAIRARMEKAFGHDFSHVRIHTDGAAQKAAEQLHAHAFTVKDNIYFNTNQFAPDTRRGERLIAHELTHVLQHDEGRLPQATGNEDYVSQPTDPAEREAYANEDRITQQIEQTQQVDQQGGYDSLHMPAVENESSASISSSNSAAIAMRRRDERVEMGDDPTDSEQHKEIEGVSENHGKDAASKEAGSNGEDEQQKSRSMDEQEKEPVDEQQQTGEDEEKQNTDEGQVEEKSEGDGKQEQDVSENDENKEEATEQQPAADEQTPESADLNTPALPEFTAPPLTFTGPPSASFRPSNVDLSLLGKDEQNAVLSGFQAADSMLETFMGTSTVRVDEIMAHVPVAKAGIDVATTLAHGQLAAVLGAQEARINTSFDTALGTLNSQMDALQQQLETDVSGLHGFITSQSDTLQQQNTDLFTASEQTINKANTDQKAEIDKMYGGLDAKYEKIKGKLLSKIERLASGPYNEYAAGARRWKGKSQGVLTGPIYHKRYKARMNATNEVRKAYKKEIPVKLKEFLAKTKKNKGNDHAAADKISNSSLDEMKKQQTQLETQITTAKDQSIEQAEALREQMFGTIESTRQQFTDGIEQSRAKSIEQLHRAARQGRQSVDEQSGKIKIGLESALNQASNSLTTAYQSIASQLSTCDHPEASALAEQLTNAEATLAEQMGVLDVKIEEITAQGEAAVGQAAAQSCGVLVSIGDGAEKAAGALTKQTTETSGTVQKSITKGVGDLRTSFDTFIKKTGETSKEINKNSVKGVTDAYTKMDKQLNDGIGSNLGGIESGFTESISKEMPKTIRKEANKAASKVPTRLKSIVKWVLIIVIIVVVAFVIGPLIAGALPAAMGATSAALITGAATGAIAGGATGIVSNWHDGKPLMENFLQNVLIGGVSGLAGGGAGLLVNKFVTGPVLNFTANVVVDTAMDLFTKVVVFDQELTWDMFFESLISGVVFNGAAKGVEMRIQAKQQAGVATPDGASPGVVRTPETGTGPVPDAPSVTPARDVSLSKPNEGVSVPSGGKVNEVTTPVNKANSPDIPPPTKVPETSSPSKVPQETTPVSKGSDVTPSTKTPETSPTPKTSESTSNNAGGGQSNAAGSAKSKPMSTKNPLELVNSGTLKELQTLPGIGRRRSQTILDHRQQHGSFKSLDDLQNAGINPSVINGIKPPKVANRPIIEILRNGDINELQTIHGIGPKRAQKIIDFRATNKIDSFDDLGNINGIGGKTVDSLKNQQFDQKMNFLAQEAHIPAALKKNFTDDFNALKASHPELSDAALLKKVVAGEGPNGKAGTQYVLQGEKVTLKALQQQGDFSRVIGMESIYKYHLTPAALKKFDKKGAKDAKSFASLIKSDPTLLTSADINYAAPITGANNMGWWSAKGNSKAGSADDLITELALDPKYYNGGMMRVTISPQQAFANGAKKPTAADGMGFNEWSPSNDGSKVGVTANGTPEVVIGPVTIDAAGTEFFF